MKLMLVTSSAPFGKAESFVVSEANAIARLGHEVVLVPTLIRESGSSFRLHDNVSVAACPLISFRFLLRFFTFLVLKPRMCFKLFSIVSDKSVSNCLKNYLVVPKAIWLAGLFDGKAVDHIHAHWLTTPSTLAMLLSELIGVPWSVTAHRGDIVANNALSSKFKRAGFVRFISHSGERLARERAVIPDGKSVVLHLGVDVEVCKDSEALEREPSEKVFTVVCPASLIPVKGHGFLIESIKKMRSLTRVKFFMVGDGELRQELERKVEALGLGDRIFFCGHQPHADLLSWYRSGSVDAVVLPSLDLGNSLHEGIPVALMEAMAFGIPVISTRTGGIPELLEDVGQQYGYLVNENSTDELSKALDNVVDNPEDNLVVSVLGRQRVMSKFNQSKNSLKLMDLIDRVGGGRKS